MVTRSVWLAKGAGLLASCLLLVSPVLAGPQHHPTRDQAFYAQPAPPPVVKVVQHPISIGVVATTSVRAKTETFTVRLRGPGGEVREFPVEGGASSIEVVRPIVLYPGQSVTIRLVAK